MSNGMSVREKQNQTNNNKHSVRKVFYKKAKIYWSKVPATIDGVMGGYGYLSLCDLQNSREFLQSLFTSELYSGDDHRLSNRNRCLDCGAGIGRVTKHLLMNFFQTVDLVEQNQIFLNKASDYIGSSYGKLGTLYCSSLHSFRPEKKYNLIWCQWVLGYLSDEDLVKFLIRCRNSLEKNGVIVVKENIIDKGNKDVLDLVDHSVIRCWASFFQIFDLCNLSLYKFDRQNNFPEELYPVRILALRPKRSYF